MDFVIDGDGHIVEPPDMWDRYLEDAYQDRKPHLVPVGRGEYMLQMGDLLAPRRMPPNHRGWDEGDVTIRLRDMDAEGIQVAVLFPSMTMGANRSPHADYVAALCRAYNNYLADYCRAAPDRLKGVALVSQRDMEDAVAELRRAVTELGFVGVMCRPNPFVVQRLDDPFHYPLYAEAERLGVPVLVHEGTVDLPHIGIERASSWLDSHMMSHSFEMMAAAMCITTSEVLDRFPRLQFAFLEAGCGWLPYWLERLDEHWEKQPQQWPAINEPPSERFKRNCYVSFEPDEVLLPQAVASVGAERLVFASDYPHWDAVLPGCVEAVTRRQDLSEADKRTLLRDSSARLYKIPVPAGAGSGASE